jgi:hypothetical protein
MYDASVVDEYVQAPKAVRRLCHGILYHGAICHVTGQYETFRAKAVYFRRYLLAAFRIYVGKRNTSAFFRHAQSRRGSNASTRASDKGDLPL